MKKSFLLCLLFPLIFSTVYGQTFWQVLGRPADSTYAYNHDQSLEFNSLGYIYFHTESGQLFLSTDEGGTWRQTSDKSFTTIKIVSNDRIIGGRNGTGEIYNSDDYGQHWYLSGTFSDYLGGTYDCTRFVTCKNGDLLAGTWGEGVHRSTDNGSSWFVGGYDVGDDYVYRINVRDDGVVFASEDDYLYSSSNNGSNWSTASRIPGNGSLQNPAITCISFSKNNYVYVGTSNEGILMSTDNGKTWSPLNKGIENQAVWSIVTDSTGSIWAGTDSGGVFYSTDLGSTWSRRNDGIVNPISVDVFSGPDNYLYAVNPKGYVFRSSNKITDITKEKSSMPKNFTLSQNYPNPFNPITTIDYSIPKSSFVSLKVYDALGREVATLVNEEKSPGNYSVVLNASQLSSGIYYYRIRTGSFTEVKKLCLIK